ncbi:MAG: gephyrin-like molybdotransferase Glp [Chloroflexota bacterium]
MVAKEFFTLQPVQEALEQLFAHLSDTPQTETIPTRQALGRVLARAPLSPMDLPAFNRSAMDGYAVKAADTHGASDALPAYLTLVGHVNMGEVPDVTVGDGETVVIHTGAMIPEGADAVVMIERTQKASDDEIEILAPVSSGENIIKLGEDVRKDSETLPAGHTIRPQDIGGLLAVGITQVEVVKRPRVAIMSSGDELVDALEEPEMGQIRDINSDMLAALCTEAGASVVQMGIAGDTLDAMMDMAKKGYADCDMLVLSAGSSVSVRDLTTQVIEELGAPGILQHGLAVKPGKPTIVAVCDGVPVIGLPGNPVSAMLVARRVLLPTLKRMIGENALPTTTITATLTQNIASSTGREDSVPIRLEKTDTGYTATPIWGKSNLIYTLLRADGLVHVPLNISGYTADTDVEVVLF